MGRIYGKRTDWKGLQTVYNVIWRKQVWVQAIELDEGVSKVLMAKHIWENGNELKRP